MKLTPEETKWISEKRREAQAEKKRIKKLEMPKMLKMSKNAVQAILFNVNLKINHLKLKTLEGLCHQGVNFKQVVDILKKFFGTDPLSDELLDLLKHYPKFSALLRKIDYITRSQKDANRRREQKRADRKEANERRKQKLADQERKLTYDHENYIYRQHYERDHRNDSIW